MSASMPPQDADELGALLGLPPEETSALDELIRCADRELARRRYGYAKDNEIPAPLWQRWEDAAWRAALRAVAEEEIEPPRRLVEALAVRDARG